MCMFIQSQWFVNYVDPITNEESHECVNDVIQLIESSSSDPYPANTLP